MAMALAITSVAGCPCTSGNCPCKCSADPWAKEDPWKMKGKKVQKDKGAGLNSGKATDFMLTLGSSNEGREDEDDDDDDDDDDDHGDGGGGGGRGSSHRDGSRDDKVDKSKITMYSRPFERKSQTSPYDGKTGGALWKKKTTNFLVTRVPEMVAALEWTERQDSVITDASLREFANSKAWRRALAGDKPTDLRIIARHLWGGPQR